MEADAKHEQETTEARRALLERVEKQVNALQEAVARDLAHAAWTERRLRELRGERLQ